MEISIKKYIEQNIVELKDRLFPVFTTDLSALSVAYKFTRLSGGHVKQSQLELKIIDADYDYCKEIESKIADIMDMEDDEPFVVTGNIRFHSSVAGGGTIFNESCQRWENTLYFIIDWRKLHVI